MGGKISSGGGQSTDVMQAVEGRRSCKRLLKAHEYPPGLNSPQWYSWLVSCCSDGDWQVRSVMMLQLVNGSRNGTCAGSGGE